MNYKNLLQPLSKNDIYLERYVSFISERKDRINVQGYTEKHHILPVSLFPEYKKDNDNIITLTGREHFLAHWMLAKALSSSKMWFVLNQMRRIGNRSVLYEYARKEISRVISESNSGRTISEEHKLALNNSIKGKSPARIVETNETLWLDKDSPLWETGEAVSLALGRKHTQETKEKLQNKNSGKSFYSNNSGDIRMFSSNNVPEGYAPYVNPKWYESTVTDTIWAYNPTTGEHIRVKEKNMPNGFLKGRKHGGWNNINNSNKLKFMNLQTKQYVMLSPNEVINNVHVRYDGNKLSSVNVGIYRNIIAVGNKNILLMLKDYDIIISNEELKSGIVKKSHHNNNEKTKLFRNQNGGKQLCELGVKIMKLSDFEMSDEYRIYSQ